MQNGRSMRKQTRVCVSVAFVVIGMVCISNTQAGLDMQTYGFYNITNNNAANAAAGEAQLSVEVSDQGTGLVGFKFINNGPADCVITEIYFQDGSILEFVSIDELLPGVDFQEEEVGNVNPKNLPGGKSIAPQFIADTAFSIQPNNPAPHLGVGPGECVEVIYALQPLKTHMDVINELNNTDMRIGIHVQSFINGGSESFVNIPEPATLVLLGLGGCLLRKRRK